MPYPHPIIAREGWPFIALALVVAIAVHAYAGWAWALFFWIVVVFMIQFFRDPPRVIPADLSAVLSPADGRIVVVERARDPYLDRDALKISVFMNVFNAHSNRSPVDGAVQNTWYFPGSFVNADLPKASLENEAVRGLAVLNLHAINPHGFSFGRSVTHESVVLSRNFIDHAAPLPANAGYEQIHGPPLPPTWPGGSIWRADVWRRAQQVFRQARQGLLQVELRPR